MVKKRRPRCVATGKRGGNLIHPCWALEEMLNERYSTRRGIVEQTFTRLSGPEKGDKRTLVIVRSGQHPKRGLVLNFCPACGERLYDYKRDTPTPAKE